MRNFKRAICLAACLGWGAVFSFAAGAEPVRFTLLDFKRESAENMLWEATPTKMGTRDIAGTLQGIGTGESRLGYLLEGKYDVLEAYIGYLSTVSKGRSSRFEVVADGLSIYVSDPIASGTEPIKVKIPIKGKNFIVIGIKPDSYGATLGAAWGDPFLISGARPEDLVQPVTVSINGKRSQIDLPGGVMPKELAVPIPLTPGITEFRVKVVQDTTRNRVDIVVEKAKP